MMRLLTLLFLIVTIGSSWACDELKCDPAIHSIDSQKYCNFSVGGNWTLNNGYLTTTDTATLTSPVVDASKTFCWSVEYKINGDGYFGLYEVSPRRLRIYHENESKESDSSEEVGKFKRAEVDIVSSNRTVFQIAAHSHHDGSISIRKSEVKEGGCRLAY